MLGMGDRVYGKELVDVFDKGKTHLEGVDIKDIIASADGFADVAPKHKYFIVDQLQQQKHITGMTGTFTQHLHIIILNFLKEMESMMPLLSLRYSFTPLPTFTAYCCSQTMLFTSHSPRSVCSV
jgi:hypothetical protein